MNQAFWRETANQSSGRNETMQRILVFRRRLSWHYCPRCPIEADRKFWQWPQIADGWGVGSIRAAGRNHQALHDEIKRRSLGGQRVFFFCFPIASGASFCP
jgi:hypothetical protein